MSAPAIRLIRPRHRAPRHTRPTLRRRAVRWLRRGLIVAVLAGLPIGLIAKGWAADAVTALGDGLLGLTAAAGYRVQEVEVTGRRHTNRLLLQQMLNVEPEAPILGIDLADAARFIERLSWVRQATVRRVLPDRLVINLEERTPFALWQYQGTLYVVDVEGVVLTDQDINRFRPLPRVVGAQHVADPEAQSGVRMPAASSEFLALIQEHPDILARLDAAVWRGNRRWDLHLSSGEGRVAVRLPEAETAAALARLSVLLSDPVLDNRDIGVIDLRQDDRITFSPTPPERPDPDSATALSDQATDPATPAPM